MRRSEENMCFNEYLNTLKVGGMVNLVSPLQ